MPEALTEWKFLGFAHDRRPAQRLPRRQGRHGQGPDGPAQPAAVPARGRRDRVHRQGHQPVGHAADGHGAADACRRPHRASRSMPTWATTPRAGVRHPGQGIAQLLLAADGARRAGLPRPTRPSAPPAGSPTARKAICPCSPRRILVTESLPLPDPRPGRRRSSTSPSCSNRASRRRCSNQSLTVQMVSQPVVVRGDGAALPDGISLRVHRADVQPALRQRAGPAHRQLRPEDPPRSSTSGRTRPPSTARWRRTRT